MKKIKRIIIMLVAVLLFNVAENVHAEVAGGGEFTQEEINKILETINVDYSERDYYVKLNDNNIVNNEIVSSVYSTISDRLEKNGYEDYRVNYITIGDNIYEFGVTIKNKNTNTIVLNDNVIVRYSNTRYDLASEINSMNEKLNQLHPELNYNIITYDLNEEDAYKVFSDDNVYKILNKKINDDRLVQQIKQVIGDQDIDVVLAIQPQVISGIASTGIIKINIYKNGNLYVSKNINYELIQGFKSKENYAIEMVQLVDDSKYQEMKQKLIDLGASGDIIYAYELHQTRVGAVSSEGSTIPTKYNLDLNVGKKYNGKNVIVLHQKNDGTYEHFNVTVANGKASVQTTELSPFMVSVVKSTSVDAVAVEENTKVKNNPQTSATNVSLYVVLISLSAAGMLVLSKRKNNTN